MKWKFLPLVVLLGFVVLSVGVYAEKVTLQFWGSVSPEWDQLVNDFNKDHPDIFVKLSDIGDTVWGSPKMLTAVAAGRGPDLIWQPRHTLKQWASQGIFRPIDSYLQRDKIDPDNWYPIQYRENRWLDQMYGLPLQTDTRFLYWNKKLFKEAGMDPETPPKTWIDLENFTVKLNKEESDGSYKQIGFIPYYGNTWTWLYAWLNGGEFFGDEEQRTATPDDPRIVEALEWMVNFYDKYLGGIGSASAFLEGFASLAQNPLVTGKLAMEGNGNWQLSFFSQFPEFEYGMAPMPYPEDGVKTTWSCAWSLTMSVSTENPDECWEFIKWATGVEGYRSFATKGFEQTVKDWKRQQLPGEAIYVPPNPTNKEAEKMLRAEFASKLPPKLRKEWELTMDGLNWTHGCGDEWGAGGLTYWVEIDKASQNALHHKMTALEALQVAKKNVQRELDRIWARVDKQRGK